MTGLGPKYHRSVGVLAVGINGHGHGQGGLTECDLKSGHGHGLVRGSDLDLNNDL